MSERVKLDTEQEQASIESSMRRLLMFEGPSEAFIPAMLQWQCSLTEAEGGALLRVNRDQAVEMVGAHPATLLAPPHPPWVNQAAAQVAEVMRTAQTRIEPVEAVPTFYGRRAEQAVVLLPLRGEGAVRGVLAFCVSGADEAQLERHRERLEFSAGILMLYEMRLALRHRIADSRRMRQCVDLMAKLNQNGHFKAAAMSFCNEVAHRWSAHRVSLGFARGRGVRVEALSHTEKFSRKTKLVRSMQATMEECLDQDLEVLHPGGPEAATVSRAAQGLAEQHGPSIVLSLPLRQTVTDRNLVEEISPGKSLGRGALEQGGATPFAVLTVERPVDQPFEATEVEMLRLTCELASPRLLELYRTDRWWGARMALDARRLGAAVVGPRYTWVKLAALLITGILAFALLGRTTETVSGSFALQPRSQAIVAAPFDSLLDRVHVEPGDDVLAGQTLLAELDTLEVRNRLAGVVQRQRTFEQEATEALREGEVERAELAQLRAMELEPEIDLLRELESRGRIVAPVSGRVISPSLREVEGTAVQRGQGLFMIASVEQLEVELLIPERYIADVKVGQEGRLAATAYPTQPLRFEVVRIAPAAEVLGQINAFKVEGRLLEDAPEWLKPGMEGAGRVEIGRASYAWVWTRDMVNWLRMRLWW
ncbi:MAG: efflux RND transporter periplasmic adaptor subunit [Phycisphaeraceae bacterium]|nr:efflux RND transporter periplasmic adaptor subunit [Phycisphaeraceae bacterium]